MVSIQIHHKRVIWKGGMDWTTEAILKARYNQRGSVRFHKSSYLYLGLGPILVVRVRYVVC